MSSLPSSWQQKTLGEVCNILAGFGFPERLQGKTSGDLPFFKVGDISSAWKGGIAYLTTANHYLSIAEAKEIRARPLPKNTTVFAKIGAAIALNRRAMLSDPALVDNNVMGLHPLDGDLDPKYLFHFVCTVKLNELSRATTVPSVRKSDIERIAIPIPPLDEQRRIVAEIEKQFTRLEAGVTALRQVQAKLKRYRAAVLKVACEGRLVPTEAELARQEGRPYEPASELLTRILTERRLRSQIRGKYKEPLQPQTIQLNPMPEGWTSTTLEQVSSLITSGSRGWGDYYSDQGPLFIRAQDIKTDKLKFESVALVQIPDKAEGSRSSVESGDLLITITGANVTKSALVHDLSEQAFVSQPVALIKPSCLEHSSFIFHWIVSPANGRRQLEAWAYGAGKPGLSLEQVRNLVVALPPLAEQTRIVAEVERRLSVVDELDVVIAANIQQAARLRQSILKRAFSGNLMTSRLEEIEHGNY